MKKIRIMTIFCTLIFMGLFITPISATVPDGYSEEVDLKSTIVYKISEANGVVEFFDFNTYTSTFCLIEKDGKIECDFVGFYADTPYFNLTFKSAAGEINQTIANVSNVDIALSLALNIGFDFFTPGILTKSTNAAWTAQDATATSIADGTLFSDSIYGTFYYNGTLSIEDKGNQHRYYYKQDPATFGNQNTTLMYNTNTGILEEFSTGFTGYFLHASSTGINIDGFPPGLITFICMISLIGIIVIKHRKKKSK